MYLRIEETLKVAVEGYTGDVNYLRNADNEIDITKKSSAEKPTVLTVG